jgi:hypothetical protein
VFVGDEEMSDGSSNISSRSVSRRSALVLATEMVVELRTGDPPEPRFESGGVTEPRQGPHDGLDGVAGQVLGIMGPDPWPR